MARAFGAFASLLTAAALVSPARAEPAACLSPDPAQWPAPSKPYFMLALDTSGSMGFNVPDPLNPPAPPFPPCSGYPGTRIGHARCGIQQAVQAFAGQVNFGLSIFANQMVNCSGATCFNGCGVQNFPGNVGNNGCGPLDVAGDPTTRHGANILVPMLQDHYWMNPPALTNVPELLSWVDNDCSNNKEVFGILGGGATPLNGILRDMYRYFSVGWTQPGGAVNYPSPLGNAPDERGCRSVNVILITDGTEDCDGVNDPPPAAAQLLAGFTKGGITWHIKTYVINFIGGDQVKTDAIAAAGGTGSSVLVSNSTQLSTTLANIIGGSVAPEVCDNTDNNCNGCTDEGYTHYCDTGQTCCSWASDAQRATCLSNYQATITAANPKGDLTKLPCTTPAQQADPAHWLCYDPGDKCDNVDNNCNSQTDEGITKCGSPLHCPSPEVCNGQDDDCNGLIDEGAVCGGCIPSPEICDGCDNDCDGIPDNGIAAIPCGLPSPANCVGQLVCLQKDPVPPGTCAPGGGFSVCNNNPLPETCDGIDNNCNGIVDDGIPSAPCVPPNAPPGLDYGPKSQCKMGTSSCVNGMTVCNGWVGPSAEVCDGIDNNCDGTVDNNVPGTGQPCGVNQLPCTPGVTACVNGALVCQGGVQPQPEICDGKDNNCNGQIDEAPLADAPAPGMNGCWSDPGNCCHFPMINPDINWCPPPGGDCFDPGTLTPPCQQGTLMCNGLAGWTCSPSKGPAPETCDGIDNDCNGAVDDGNLPGVGGVCGSSIGECKQGVLGCANGVLTCMGATGPTPEICDGLDNDCNGQIDNGVPVGGPCTPVYDTMAYPGPRNSLPCQPGVYHCNGQGGITCVGGVGPSPEVCDGIDNDCDGQIDEPGAAPDGINGSANPHPPPMANIGDDCGVNQGVCSQGKYACVNGVFACLGGQAPTPESCDCQDNDCDGTIDNQNPNNSPPLCSPGKDCINTGTSCQCAPPCSPQAEFPCPPGQTCQQVNDSQTGMPKGTHCVSDPCAGVNCATVTVKDANSAVVCAPAGTKLPNCVTPPVCVCKGQNGCQDPCLGVTCQPGLICASAGANAGKCVVDNCYNNPCQGCDKACNGGSCVDDPCKAGACPPDQECKPSPDFMTPVCVPSCAMVSCPSGKKCVEGACVDTCNPDCKSGETCDTSQSPPACVPSKCAADSCPNGGCCDPLTGACGNCPCEGVVCPDTQVCSDGSCVEGMGTGGSSSATSSSGSAGGGEHASSSSSSGGGQGGSTRGVWGLATGGGGCACAVGPGADDRGGLWALAAIAAIACTSRRRRRSVDAPRA